MNDPFGAFHEIRDRIISSMNSFFSVYHKKVTKAAAATIIEIDFIVIV